MIVNNKIPFGFNRHKVTVIQDEHGEPWWIAKEVCELLGLKNVSKALVELDQDEKRSISGSKVGYNVSKLRIINEPGLYSLIFKSRKPEAVAFQDWVCEEVLPSIRKTGSYHVPMTREDHFASALREANSYLEKLDRHKTLYPAQMSEAEIMMCASEISQRALKEPNHRRNHGAIDITIEQAIQIHSDLEPLFDRHGEVENKGLLLAKQIIEEYGELNPRKGAGNRILK